MKRNIKRIISLSLLARQIFGVAKEILEEQKLVAPHCLLEDENHEIVYVALQEDEIHWGTSIRHFLEMHNTIRYYFVNEAWSTNLENHIRGVAVRDNPLKYEVLHVLAVSRTGEQLLLTQQVSREGSEIRFLGEVVEATVVKTFQDFPMKW